MKAFRALVSTLLIAGLSSCSAPPTIPQASPAEEAQIRKMLIGTWHEVQRSATDTAAMQKTFYKDGTAKGFLTGRVSSGGMSIIIPRQYFTSNWKLNGRNIVIYNMRQENGELLFEKDEVHYDAILAISDREMRYYDGQSKTTSTVKRGPLRDPTLP